MNGQGRTTFWQELGRRNVLRVGAAYAVASFAIIEVVSNVTPGLHLPDWVLSLVIVLLGLGFPAALAFSWIYEITPDGLKRTEDVEANASITHRTAHRLNVVTIALMVLLAGLYGADRFLPARQTAEAVNPAAPQNASAGISLAVLPFVNLAGDPSQEFFSDGMTEEITSALAKVKGLKVVARTSAFQFKGENKDMRAVGQALGATILLEGSLRKSGNRIRITGQLIKAADGTHIWTENYDRELTDIFKTQDDIATAIAAALQVPLGLNAGETLVANRNISPENYQQYLRAKALWSSFGVEDRAETEAVGVLEEVVGRDPSYAPAWGLLAMLYIDATQEEIVYRTGSPEEYRPLVDASIAKAEAAGRRAIELDPANVEAYIGLALAQNYSARLAGAVLEKDRLLKQEDLLLQALKLDPFHPHALGFYSHFLAGAGRLKEAMKLRQQIQLIEPFVPRHNWSMSWILFASGQAEAALGVAKALPAATRARVPAMARAYAEMGRYADAADVILNSPTTASSPENIAAAQLLRMAPAKSPPRDLPLRISTDFAYLYVGAPQHYLDSVERRVDAGVGRSWDFISPFSQYPSYAAVRKTERFKALMRKIGLVDYWRARGWPDVCRPVGADDFECS